MCDSCEVLNINGLNCHELGCPNAWQDIIRECKWCGTRFKPENKVQLFCDQNCSISYCG